MRAPKDAVAPTVRKHSLDVIVVIVLASVVDGSGSERVGRRN